jgi:hypothetical protein
MTKPLNKRNTAREDDCRNRYKKAYFDGVMAHQKGMPDENKYGDSRLLEKCAFSGGYFDSMRKLV